MSNKQFSFYVPASCDGVRLDTCVSTCIDHYSRSYLASIARNGDIYVNGVSKKPSYKVSKGEVILGFICKKGDLNITAESIPLEIIYEDSNIIVVNKDSGMVVHPSPGHPSGTVVNAVMYLCPHLKAISGSIRPGVVHRLDKDTTGLLVIAKTAMSLTNISYQFQERTVTKKYRAVVYGVPSNKYGRVDFEIGRHPVDRKKMSINSRRPRSAETLWKVLEEYHGIASLLELEIKTGRTHQIRVHCKAIGHPIIGDQTYKNRGQKREFLKKRPEMTKAINRTKRQMLHAYKIELKHPRTQKYLKLQADLPKDMLQLLNVLRN